MSEHKFVYTVSGIHLTEEQKATISREIGATVSRVLAGNAPSPVSSEFLNISKIHGGIWITVESAALKNVGEIIAGSEKL